MRLTDRQDSRLRLLRAIRRAEPVARTELAALTGYTTQAVSDLVAELRARGLVIETRGPAAGRGRPRTMLQIDPAGAMVVGAFLYPDHRLGIEVADLRGASLFSEAHRLPVADTMEAMSPLMASAIRQTMSASGVPTDRIHGVGLGVTGLVDSRGGIAHYMPRYDARPVPLADLLARELGLPVYLDSAADVLTRAEHWYGEDRQVDDFALLFVGFGLGFGQYVDGVLRTGSHGLNAEIAHLKLTHGQGPVCYCGSRGCLGTYASVSGVVSGIAAARGLPRPRLEETTAALHAFADEARRGVPDAVEAFGRAGALLGAAAANLMMLNDPSRLVIKIQDRVFHSMIAGHFRASIEENLLPAMRGLATVDIHASEEVAFAKGTAALILETIYRGQSA